METEKTAVVEISFWLVLLESFDVAVVTISKLVAPP